MGCPFVLGAAFLGSLNLESSDELSDSLREHDASAVDESAHSRNFYTSFKSSQSRDRAISTTAARQVLINSAGIICISEIGLGRFSVQ